MASKIPGVAQADQGRSSSQAPGRSHSRGRSDHDRDHRGRQDCLYGQLRGLDCHADRCRHRRARYPDQGRTEPTFDRDHPGRQDSYTDNAGDGTVTPIDLATHIARAPIDVPGAPGPNGDGAPWVIAITPNGKTAYVATVGGKLIPIHLATGTLGKPIGGVGSFPQIAIAPNGKVAYVTNSGSQTILPIDLTTGLRGAAIRVGPDPPQEVVIVR